MSLPQDLLYTKEHEWVRVSGDGIATIGITDYAQTSLGDVTFVDLPKVGASFAAGKVFGVVESVKAASDLYMPVGGEVVEVNSALVAAPEKVNSDPYGAAWMVKVRMADAGAVAGLLAPAAYAALIG
jgi:glycine cleavage system H protein